MHDGVHYPNTPKIRQISDYSWSGNWESAGKHKPAKAKGETVVYICDHCPTKQLLRIHFGGGVTEIFYPLFFRFRT
jgi:hypothetical protein